MAEIRRKKPKNLDIMGKSGYILYIGVPVRDAPNNEYSIKRRSSQ